MNPPIFLIHSWFIKNKLYFRELLMHVFHTMMKNIFLIILTGTLLFVSCKDNTSSEIDYNPNVLSSRDYIRGEDAIFEVVNSFFKGVYDSLVLPTGYNYIDNCDVTFRASENSIAFGYGPVNRYCDDNKFRKGYFVATFSGPIFDQGVNAHIVTDSLFVDDLWVELVMDIENLGINANNRPEFSMKVDSSDIMLPDTTKINGVKIKTDFTLIWDEGYLTPTIHEDDKFLVTGNASGISSDGYHFTLNLQQPSVNYLDCFWIFEEVSEITVPSGMVQSGEIVKEDTCYNEFFFYFDESKFFDQIK